MIRYIILIAAVWLTVSSAPAASPRYVFLMIGDGMGVNQVAATERFLAAEEDGRIGRKPLTMATFPYSALCHTYSLSNGVTDSSAAGTALSTGHKTSNGTLGMDSSHSVAYPSVAELAHRAGRAVGIVTSVSIDHATPGAFYAHVPSRKHYYKIGRQMAASGFDFFGGADFLAPAGKKHDSRHLHDVLADSGYTVVKGYDAYLAAPVRPGKIFLTQADGRGNRRLDRGRSSLPFAIDRDSADLTLPQMTAAAIDFLSKKDCGFFLMVEGGAIDWACHSNDAATAFAEVVDFDAAVAVAYDFYLQHPDETLIVVTADHETGGLAMGNGDYRLRFDLIGRQQCSLPGLSKAIAELFASHDGAPAWEDMKALLSDRLGLFSVSEPGESDEAALHAEFEKSLSGTSATVDNEYAEDHPLAVAAVRLLNRLSRCGWTTGAHSGAPVAVYAAGVGADRFTGVLDNTDIPRRIIDITGYRQ